jgi:hypothetical protein
MKKIIFILTSLIPSFLYSQSIIIPNVEVPAGCYPDGKYIYHMYNVVKLTGLVNNGEYYIRRDDSYDNSPLLTYLELLYPPNGTRIVGHNFTIIGDGGAEGLLYRYIGTSSTESFDYNFEIPNSDLIVGSYTDRPGIRIRKNGSSTIILKRGIITVVNPANISGSSLSCTTSVSFTLLNQPFGSNVSWVIKQNGITKAQGTGINAQASNLSNGLGNVLYTISFPCNSSSKTVNKDFWIGPPILNSVTGPNTGYTYNTYTFYADPRRDPASLGEYTWILNPLNGNNLRPYYDYVDIAFYNPYQFYQVVCRATNGCGTTDYKFKNISIYDRYSINPNPSSEFLAITDDQALNKGNDNTNEIDNTNLEYSLRVYDYFGNLQSAYQRSGPTFSFPTNILKEGNYILQINDGSKTVSLKFIVKH